MGYILVVSLILVTAIFVAIEMAVFSVRAERLGIAADKGDKRGDIVLGFLNDPPRFLSAFQIVTTLTSILIGAYGQSYITAQWQPRLEAMGLPGSAAWAFWLTVAATTFLSLIFANLVPKQVGFVWAEEVSMITARFSNLYVTITRPLAWILEATARGLSKLLGIPISSLSRVTEADVVYMMKEGRHHVELDPSERAIAEKAFALSDIKVTDSMTRRDSIAWVDKNWPIPKIREFVAEKSRSYYPLCDGKLDKVEGILKSRDLLAMGSDKLDPKSLLELAKEPLVIPRNARLLQVTEMLKSSDSRVALVADEHGGIVGMITLNDLVATIVGPLCGIK